jgi:hypothetical protein
MAQNPQKQNEFLKGFVGNCKPYTIFTATKRPLSAGKQFFCLRLLFFYTAHTNSFCVCIYSTG